MKQLEQLLIDLPRGDVGRELNFAIAQAGTPQAQELLIQISQSDPDSEQRAGALFWLAQEFPQAAQLILLETVHSESDSEVLEQAVFAISQLPEDMAGPMLLELAKATSRRREKSEDKHCSGQHNLKRRDQTDCSTGPTCSTG